jgi:hypothetical protein
VKIRIKKSKKSYLDGKYVYRYIQYLVCIPKDYHEAIIPLLETDYDIHLTVKNKTIFIVMRPRENVSVPEKPPRKTRKERRLYRFKIRFYT